MELPLHYTISRNRSYAAVAAGKYNHISIFHFDHNPEPAPQYVTNGSVVSGWLSAPDALNTIVDKSHGNPNGQSVLEQFSGACWCVSKLSNFKLC